MDLFAGKVLRITRDGAPAPGNPFMGAGTDPCGVDGTNPGGQTCQEIYADRAPQPVPDGPQPEHAPRSGPGVRQRRRPEQLRGGQPARAGRGLRLEPPRGAVRLRPTRTAAEHRRRTSRTRSTRYRPHLDAVQRDHRRRLRPQRRLGPGVRQRLPVRRLRVRRDRCGSSPTGPAGSPGPTLVTGPRPGQRRTPAVRPLPGRHRALLHRLRDPGADPAADLHLRERAADRAAHRRPDLGRRAARRDPRRHGSFDPEGGPLHLPVGPSGTEPPPRPRRRPSPTPYAAGGYTATLRVRDNSNQTSSPGDRLRQRRQLATDGHDQHPRAGVALERQPASDAQRLGRRPGAGVPPGVGPDLDRAAAPQRRPRAPAAAAERQQHLVQLPVPRGLRQRPGESYVEIILEATDAGGLTGVAQRDIQPQRINVRLASNPTGRRIRAHGRARSRPRRPWSAGPDGGSTSMPSRPRTAGPSSPGPTAARPPTPWPRRPTSPTPRRTGARHRSLTRRRPRRRRAGPRGARWRRSGGRW